MFLNNTIGVNQYCFNNRMITKITNTDKYDNYVNFWDGSYDKLLIQQVSESYPNLYLQEDVDISLEKTKAIDVEKFANDLIIIDSISPTLFILCNNNYLHFLYENIGRILYLKMLGIDFNLILAATFNSFDNAKNHFKFLQSPFNQLKIDPNKHFLPIHHYKNIKINKVIDTNPESQIHLESYKIISQILRDNFRKSGQPIKNIYISRKNSNKHNPRFIKNEELIEQYYQNLGYDIVYNENLTFDEQIDLYSNAKNIVGISGTGLVNILFAPDECKVTEIRTSNYRNDDVFKYISEYVGNNYKLIKSYNSNGNALTVLEDIKNISLS